MECPLHPVVQIRGSVVGEDRNVVADEPAVLVHLERIHPSGGFPENAACLGRGAGREKIERLSGNRAGKEVVQLYLRDLAASVVRPVQQLIDYRKILLEPEESRDVVFTVTEEQLRFYDFDCREVSEPGEFELSTGFADHLLLTKRLFFTLI